MTARQTRVNEFLNAVPTGRDRGISEFYPANTIWEAPGVLLITLTGASTQAMIRHIINSYLQNRDLRDARGFTPFAALGADTIFSFVSTYAAENIPRVIIAGYSWGGAVAVALANNFRRSNSSSVISCLTFGAPKPGDDRLGLAIQGIDLTRYQNTGDAVTTFPPPAGNASIMYALTPASGYHNLLDNHQVGRGLVIDADFVVSPGDVVPENSMFTDLSLANFLISNESPIAQYHALETYAHRLDNAFVESSTALAPSSAVNAANYQASPRSGPVIRSPRSGVIPPPPVPDSVRPPQPAASSPNPYVSQKINGAPCVTFLDVVIAVCKTSKASRNLARSLNTSWRRWNATRIGDSSALQHSVEVLFVD